MFLISYIFIVMLSLISCFSSSETQNDRNNNWPGIFRNNCFEVKYPDNFISTYEIPNNQFEKKLYIINRNHPRSEYKNYSYVVISYNKSDETIEDWITHKKGFCDKIELYKRRIISGKEALELNLEQNIFVYGIKFKNSILEIETNKISNDPFIDGILDSFKIINEDC